MLGEVTKSKTAWIIRLVRFFIYTCLVLLGVYTSIQLFDTPTRTSEKDVVPTGTRVTETIVVAFGDSVTAGYGIALDKAYPSVLEQVLIARGYDVRVVNAGVSGETTAGGLRRVDFIKSQKPDIVILALGGNDVLRGVRPEETKNNLREIIISFQEDDIPVLLVGMYAPNNLGNIYGTSFKALYPALRDELDVPLVPFLLEGVALKDEFNQSDGIHPNEKGAEVIAKDVILPALIPLLKKVSSI